MRKPCRRIALDIIANLHHNLLANVQEGGESVLFLGQSKLAPVAERFLKSATSRNV
jgi:hypothetical protein